jgi:hypothetical protein
MGSCHDVGLHDKDPATAGSLCDRNGAELALAGLVFAVKPDTIHQSREYMGAGIWVVGATGAIALVGGVIVAVTKPD